jgi:tetratricopeptide (TPR) repeat protein
MAAKLSKQELKEPDKFQIMISHVLTYLAENKTKITIASAVFTTLIVIAGAWYLYNLNMEKSAQQLYARAYYSPTGEGAAGIYKEVLEKYPRSRAAMLTNYRLAGLYYQQMDFDAAIRSYEAFLQKIPDKRKPLPTWDWDTAMRQKRILKPPLPPLKKRRLRKPETFLRA